MSAAETGQMSAVETRQMYSTIKTGQSPVAIVDICPVSTADICPVSEADICPVSTADICPVSTEEICPVSAADVLGGDENDFDPFFRPKMFKMEFIRGCPGEPGEMVAETLKWNPTNNARWPGLRQLNKLPRISMPSQDYWVKEQHAGP